MHQTAFQYVNWVVCTAAMVVVLVAMVRRRLTAEYRLFFWYTVAHVLEAVLLFIASQLSYATYYYMYWGWELIDALFTLIVIQFVFVKVFDSYQTLRGFGVTLFRWVTVVLCLVSISIAAYAPANSPENHVFAGLTVMERSVQLLQVGLLVSLLLCSRIFGLPWRHYIYGIILGFGIYASLALVTWGLQAQLGPSFIAIADWSFALSYTLGACIWASYFLSSKTAAVSSNAPSSEQLHAWNEALAGILRK